MSDPGLSLSPPTTSVPATSRAARWRIRALAVAAATAAALIVWLIAKPLLGIALTLPMAGGAQTMEVGWGSVLVISLVASLAGWGLLAILERFTPRARVTWIVFGSVALLLSFAGPGLAASAASGATRVALAIMHMVVAAVLIPSLARTSPSRPDAARSERMSRR